MGMLAKASNVVTHITTMHGSAGFADSNAQLHSQHCCSLHWQMRKHSSAVTKPTTMILQDLQTLILVNCGATEDVAKLLDLQESVRVIVIDSHRPFHHNLNDRENINILAFCNPADGTCDNVPEPDIFSGTDNLQPQASCNQVCIHLRHDMSCTHMWTRLSEAVSSAGSDDEDDDDEAENEEEGFDDDAENDSNRPNRRSALVCLI